MLAVRTALLEHFVDQRGLAVVNVGDDGDVSQFLHFAHFLKENHIFLDISVCTNLHFSMENLILQHFSCLHSPNGMIKCAQIVNFPF